MNTWVVTNSDTKEVGRMAELTHKSFSLGRIVQ